VYNTVYSKSKKKVAQTCIQALGSELIPQPAGDTVYMQR